MRSRRQLSLRAVLGVGALLGIIPAAIPAPPFTERGPSSSQSPYLVPVGAGVRTIAILTVGDSVNSRPDGTPYRLVGIPDGLGEFWSTAGQSFTLLMNHELPATAGIPRAHGQPGAFVSKWEIDRRTLQVRSGEDLIRQVETTGSSALGRLCSADLPDREAFWNKPSHTGTSERILLSGEEVGNEGRLFAHVATGTAAGTSFELPSLGKFSWENAVSSHGAGRKTIVVGMDDSTPGQVYVYVGDKQQVGTDVERAGLTGGALYGVRAAAMVDEPRSTALIPASQDFVLETLGDVAGMTGAQIQTASEAAGITEFLRPEDGAWDPRRPSDFYFVTTDRFNTPTQEGRSRLWRLRFRDLDDPAAGGSLTMLLNGTEGQQMMDNLAVDRWGRILIQEDPGNQVHLARVLQYTIRTGEFKVIAQHDPTFFLSGSPQFLTQDEESSGIIDASEPLGPGWFMLDVQAHYPIPGELVEGGQLLALFSPLGNAKGAGQE